MLLAESNPHWPEQFAQERTRLLATLGEVTDGGIVESLQHIGATSVPGLPSQPCIDIALAIAPFPLQPECLAALVALGYTRVPAAEDAPEQRFMHSGGSYQLFVMEAGDERWTAHLLIRDYLRNDSEAGQRYALAKRALAVELPVQSKAEVERKDILLRPILAAAHSWWVNYYGFTSMQAIVQELATLSTPWYIASGWALDLFLGQTTRVHHDVDVVVAFADQLILQHYMTERGWKFVTPFEKRLELWPPHMRLELPRFQAHAHRNGLFIDFLLSDIAHGIWRYRREPSIVRSSARMTLRTQDGLSYLAPEIVLLFKSRNTSGKERSKDQADFEKVYPHLAPEPRAWLRWALIAIQPEHPWIACLA